MRISGTEPCSRDWQEDVLSPQDTSDKLTWESQPWGANVKCYSILQNTDHKVYHWLVWWTARRMQRRAALFCLDNELQASQSYGETLSQTLPPPSTTREIKWQCCVYWNHITKKTRVGTHTILPNTQLEIVCRHFSQVIDDIPAINSIYLF